MNNLQTNGLIVSINEVIYKIDRILKPYRIILFIIFVALLYGFVLQRITTLVNTEPTDDAIYSQVQSTKLPRIDPKIVQQLKSLEDNSVSVKTLFNDARSNPFQ